MQEVTVQVEKRNYAILLERCKKSNQTVGMVIKRILDKELNKE